MSMNDTDYERTKARIQAALARWLPSLGLESWRIAHEYDRTGQEVDQTHAQPGYTGIAECCSNWSHWRASIVWSVPGFFEIKDDTEFENHVIHELVHVLLAELADTAHMEDGSRHLERTVTMLANVLQNVRQTAETTGRVLALLSAVSEETVVTAQHTDKEGSHGD